VAGRRFVAIALEELLQRVVALSRMTPQPLRKMDARILRARGEMRPRRRQAA
jgi:hypothetical protein